MDNLKNIINEIKTNGGCNIGCDYDIKNLKKGYMISLASYEKTIDLNDVNDLNDVTIQKKLYNAIIEKINIIKGLKILNQKSAFYCGLWYYESEKKLYFDISINIKDFKTAFNRGIKENQYFIYDLENQKEVAIEKDVFIVYKYNKIKNDFIYYYECMTRKELYNTLNISERRARDIIVNSIDNYDLSKLYLNKYCIVKDSAFYRDLNIE